MNGFTYFKPKSKFQIFWHLIKQANLRCSIYLLILVICCLSTVIFQKIEILVTISFISCFLVLGLLIINLIREFYV